MDVNCGYFTIAMPAMPIVECDDFFSKCNENEKTLDWTAALAQRPDRQP